MLARLIRWTSWFWSVVDRADHVEDEAVVRMDGIAGIGPLMFDRRACRADEMSLNARPRRRLVARGLRSRGSASGTPIEFADPMCSASPACFVFGAVNVDAQSCDFRGVLFGQTGSDCDSLDDAVHLERIDVGGVVGGLVQVGAYVLGLLSGELGFYVEVFGSESLVELGVMVGAMVVAASAAGTGEQRDGRGSGCRECSGGRRGTDSHHVS